MMRIRDVSTKNGSKPTYDSETRAAYSTVPRLKRQLPVAIHGTHIVAILKVKNVFIINSVLWRRWQCSAKIVSMSGKY